MRGSAIQVFLVIRDKAAADSFLGSRIHESSCVSKGDWKRGKFMQSVSIFPKDWLVRTVFASVSLVLLPFFTLIEASAQPFA